MEKINPKLPEPKKHQSERGSLLTDFMDKLNQDRGKLKPVTIKQLAVLLSKFSVQELYQLKSNCQQAKNFGKCFWWFVRNRLSTD